MAVRFSVDVVSGGSIPQCRLMISVELHAERVLIKIKKNFLAGGLLFICNTFVERRYFGQYTPDLSYIERQFNGLPRAERVRVMNEYYKWQDKFHKPSPPPRLSKKQLRKMLKPPNSNSGVIYCPYVPVIVSTNTGP